jgi:ATP-binding cassette subfamily B protein
MVQERNVEATKLAIRHYWQQVLKDWRIAFPALILPGIGNIFVFYVPPLIIAKILVTYSHNTHPSAGTLLPYVLWFTIIWSAGEVIWRISEYLLVKVEVNGVKRLYAQAMEFLFAKDQAFFNDNFAGSLTKRVIGYGRHYTDVMDTIFYSVTSSLIPVIFAAVVLWHYSPWLVVSLFSLLTLTASVIAPLIKRRQKLVSLREASSNVMAGNVADAMTNMATVRAFAKEKYELNRHNANVNTYMERTRHTWNYHILKIDVATSPLYVLTNVVGLIIALSLSSNGSLDIAAIFISFNYFAQISGIVWKFNQVYRNLESSVTDAAQFTELLLEPPCVNDTAEPADFKSVKGAIQFKNVSFRYSDSSGQHLFSNLNLDIKEGEKVALVGHSGGGKTTVTMLLLRFMDISGGEILIDGQNIAHIKQRELRSQISYVPQDPALFHRTLADNVRYGRQDATDEEVKSVAKMAHANEFIKELSHGYETLVGERGVKLSGGQRQRIAIARAMLKNAPILVLDEATSALDSESEKLIQDALWKLMESRTSIVIAHRLSTIQHMDRIVVLDDGKVIEDGSHQELLAQKGVYAKLWGHQSGGFLED